MPVYDRVLIPKVRIILHIQEDCPQRIIICRERLVQILLIILPLDDRIIDDRRFRIETDPADGIRIERHQLVEIHLVSRLIPGIIPAVVFRLDCKLPDLVIFASPVIISLADLEQLIRGNTEYRDRRHQYQIRQNALPLRISPSPSSASSRLVYCVFSPDRTFFAVRSGAFSAASDALAVRLPSASDALAVWLPAACIVTALLSDFSHTYTPVISAP